MNNCKGFISLRASLVMQLVKHLPAKCERSGFNPWVGKIPWRKERLPTPVFWPGEFHGLYSLWGLKESDTTDWLALSLFKDEEEFCHSMGYTYRASLPNSFRFLANFCSLKLWDWGPISLSTVNLRTAACLDFFTCFPCGSSSNGGSSPFHPFWRTLALGFLWKEWR